MVSACVSVVEHILVYEESGGFQYRLRPVGKLSTSVSLSSTAIPAKVSAAQPTSPSWTARDGYGSEATTVTAASHQSRGGNGNHLDHRHHRLESSAQASVSSPSSSSRRRRQQQLSMEALPGHRRRSDDAADLVTEGREREREWEPREVEGDGDVHRFHKHSDDGGSSGGSRRWRQNRWVPQ